MTHKREQSWFQLPYNLDYTPSAPGITIEIAGPETNDWIETGSSLIDTGADTTIIPQALLAEIAAAEWDQAWLRSQWGEPRLVYRYEIDIRREDRVFPSVLVVADEIGDEVILGRDFTNSLRILLDGPARIVALLE